MSEQYNGNPSTILLNLLPSVNIVSTTNANPIVVQTASPHGMTTNDYCNVANHHTNITANGVNQVTVIDSTHFSIPVAGVAAGGGNGTVQPYTLGPTITLPTDGDARNAASVDVPFEAIADRSSLLGLTTGKYKIVQTFRSLAGAPPALGVVQTWFNGGLTGVSNTWTPANLAPSSTAPAPLLISGTNLNDICLITFSGTIEFSLSSNSLGCMALMWTLTPAGGGAPLFPYTLLAGTCQIVTLSSQSSNVTLYNCSALIGASGLGEVVNVQPAFYVFQPVTTAVILGLGESNFQGQVLRPTGIPQ